MAGSKQKKMNARVDFTPMVDMIMLLVTFFMLCTTLMKPQTMQLVMPSDKENINEQNRSQIAESKAITILIGGNRELYYFKGKPTEDNLKSTKYGKDGIRAVLMEANAAAQQRVKALKAKFDTPSIIIKPSDKASYKDLIDVLDEMQICSIGKYVIDKFDGSDQAKIDRLNGK